MFMQNLHTYVIHPGERRKLLNEEDEVLFASCLNAYDMWILACEGGDLKPELQL
jgi:hypothetical protein